MDKTILKSLFNDSLLVEIIRIDVKRSDRISNMAPVDYSLSPQSKKILSYLSPASQMRLARDFYLDDLKIQKQLTKSEELDPSYSYFDAAGNGSYLELWICANLNCPGCGAKLYKYASLNMPVIDVCCINENHTIHHGPKYYQIKATLAGNTFRGQKYFDLQNLYISVGSVRYGYNCHIIKADDSLDDKSILIGYICIEYNYYETQNKITINMHNSFIVIPNLLYKIKQNDDDISYYKYLTYEPIPAIQINPKVCFIINFDNFAERFNYDKTIFKNISLSNYYDGVKVRREDAPLPLKF